MTLPNLHDPVGRHVSRIETTVRVNQTIGEALDDLRARRIKQHITYFYVIDEDDRLVGVLSTRRLLLDEPRTAIRDVMDNRVVSIPHTMTLDEALEFFAMYRMLAFPVVDDDGRLLGIVDVQLYAQEIFDLAESHRAGDLYQMVGLTVEQARQPTAIGGYKLRLPWLMCNMAGGVACAVIAALFERTLQEIVLLAMFIPLVLTLSESIAMQSMAMSLHFMHHPGVSWPIIGRRAHVEWRTAAMLGLTCGVLVALASLLWGGGSATAGVFLISIGLAMLVSALLGIAVPVALHLFKLDPKIASGPVVLMSADVLTTSVYLGLATWLLL